MGISPFLNCGVNTRTCHGEAYSLLSYASTVKSFAFTCGNIRNHQRLIFIFWLPFFFVRIHLVAVRENFEYARKWFNDIIADTRRYFSAEGMHGVLFEGD